MEGSQTFSSCFDALMLFCIFDSSCKFELSSPPIVVLVLVVIVGLRIVSQQIAEMGVLLNGEEQGRSCRERGRDVWCVSAAKPLSPLQECEHRLAVGVH